MCSNVKSVAVGVLMHPAVMFMNSNKSESNIRQLIQQNRQKCSMAGIALMNETIVNKEPNRDIDRDAVNMLINRLITGQYDTVVVENMTDITADEYKGVACIWDTEAGLFMPDFDVTIVYEGNIETQEWLYYEQDGMVVTLGNWLNGRLSCEQIEQLWCELIIPENNDNSEV